MSSPLPRLIAAALTVVRIVGLIVPRRDRSAWRREWEHEILNQHLALERERRSTWRAQMPLTRRALGSLVDAAWLSSGNWEVEIACERFPCRVSLAAPVDTKAVRT